MAVLYGEILNFRGLAPIEPAVDVLGDRAPVPGLQITDVVNLRIEATQPSRAESAPYKPTDFEAWFTSLRHPAHALLGEPLTYELLVDEDLRRKGDRRTRVKLGGLATFPAFDSIHTVSIDVEAMMLHAPQSWQRSANRAIIVENILDTKNV